MSSSKIKKSFGVGILTAFIFLSVTVIGTNSMAFAQKSSGLGALSSILGSDSTDASDSTTPAAISCGQVIKHSIKLTANLDCSTDGIIVGADGITVDLNGYTITGPGIDTSKVGLMLADANDVKVVGPGTVQNFQAGILNTGGTGNKITGLTLLKNAIAVFSTGAKKTDIENNLIFNNNIGYASHSSSDATLLTNIFNLNKLAGVTFVNSEGNQVITNTIQGSVNGVFLDGQSSGNTISSNSVLKNTGVDLNNGNGLPTNINNNAFTDNNCNNSVPVGLCLGR